jgi:DNA polymerase I-like protein with 3'-5' exonuclease and polymerase domains
MRPTTRDAYEFFSRGTEALSIVEHNGITVDEDYLDATMEDVASQIRHAESRLKEDKVYQIWRKRYKEPNLESTTQLAEVLFNQMGYEVKERTETGKAKADERALESIDLPFVKDFLACKKLRKVLGTYLRGIKRETYRGLCHPSYNLAGGLSDERKGGAMSFRGSSSDPNFQNMPIRNKTMGKLIRSCFKARKGFLLGEVDFSTIEVRIAACVTKDKNLIAFVKDKKKDMHRDAAGKLFGFDQDFMVRHKDHFKKTIRDCAKNKFVFPQFYGSYYLDCALFMWESMERGGWTVPGSGKTVKEHLASQGVRSRGACDEDRPPKPGTFEHRVMEVENWMWNDRSMFWEYTAWKKRWYEAYLKTGEVHLPTGFTARGAYRRNQVLNLPIQGPAFHCLLWSIIRLQEWFARLGMKSMIVGQIHDCILLDIHESEVQKVLDLCHLVMSVELPKVWDWIIVPLEIEVDVVPEGMSWNEKTPWVKTAGVWAAA